MMHRKSGSAVLHVTTTVFSLSLSSRDLSPKVYRAWTARRVFEVPHQQRRSAPFRATRRNAARARHNLSERQRTLSALRVFSVLYLALSRGSPCPPFRVPTSRPRLPVAQPSSVPPPPRLFVDLLPGRAVSSFAHNCGRETPSFL